MARVLAPSELVREARARAGLSQRQLAQRADTTQSVIARIETGATDPGSRTLARVLRAAGYEARCELQPVTVVESHMLDDVRRILMLTPEQRLLEVANLAAFERAVRSV
jgi:predicted transcriptional regulator